MYNMFINTTLFTNTFPLQETTLTSVKSKPKYNKTSKHIIVVFFVLVAKSFHVFFGFHVRELTYRPYAIGFIRKSCVRPSVQASGSCQLPCKMEGVDLYQAGCYMIINLRWRIHFLSIQNAVPNQCKIRRFAYFLVARWDPMRMALALWITTPKGTPEFFSYCTPFWYIHVSCKQKDKEVCCDKFRILSFTRTP